MPLSMHTVISSTPSLALSCSPRAGGNSDALASAFAQGFRQGVTQGFAQEGASLGPAQKFVRDGALSISIDHLRNYTIKPCVACYVCEVDSLTHQSKPCPLGQGPKADQAEQLFHMLMQAPALYMSAPIFFYHLPAHVKAFVDRGQSYWLRRMAHDAELCALPPRPAWVSLVAARKKGDKLFEGSLITLRFFLKIFNFVLQEPQTLLGYDEANAVRRDDVMMAHTVAYGERAATSLRMDTWRRG